MELQVNIMHREQSKVLITYDHHYINAT